jgi:hypothetical protein
VGGFDPASLFIDLIVSSIGFALFMYGKKENRLPQLIGGLSLMVYPYFVSTALGLFGGGAVIIVAVCISLWLGW